MPSQNAVVVRKVGQPLELTELPIPLPQPGEVLVKVSVCQLLPHDTYSRDMGLFAKGHIPFVPASNVAGTVDRVGPGVTSFSAGDRIFGYSISRGPASGSEQGGLQQYAILDDDAIGKIPDSFTDEQVVTLPTNLVTAWQALYTDPGLGLPNPISPEGKRFDYAKETIVILAAGSNIGKLAVQIARIAGIGKIIAVAGESNRQGLLKMGATHFLDRRASYDEIVSGIRSLSDIRMVFDCYSPDFELGMALLSTTEQSMFRTTQPISSEQKKKFEQLRPRCNAAFIEGTNASLRPYGRGFWEAVPAWLINGEILPAHFRVIGGIERVEEINQALDAYASGTAGPQTIVRVWSDRILDCSSDIRIIG